MSVLLKNLVRPRCLQAGDLVAAVSLSWGGAAIFPHRYETGKSQFEQAYGIRVVEMKHTLKSPAWIAQNPAARADDLMEAFTNPEISGIVSVIGGDDSVLILPYLDIGVIEKNPKLFVGYSDTTVTHFACLKAGVTSFYGPSIMAGFAENAGLHSYMRHSIEKTMFSPEPVGTIMPAQGWTTEHLDWASPENQKQARKMNPNTGWVCLQGTGRTQGRLIGGCVSTMQMIEDTNIWPELDVWRDGILFCEVSEELSSADDFKLWLRHMGEKGILQVLNGILFGRPSGQTPKADWHLFDEAFLSVIRDELSLTSLAILSHLDFGHTDPMFVLPYGVMAEIDCDKTSLAILEKAVLPRS
ncbi:MAG: LD-carboxypeptidase [Alphaproteobacteria bacterium]|nr:LD-carboxypeptidase [Alphaproteobacteria bacterium]